MAKQYVSKPNVNRREFMARTAAVGSAAVLAGRASRSTAQPQLSAAKDGADRVGISEAAYKKAWNRAEVMVAKMTLAEKISQTGGANNLGYVPAIKRLGIPAYNYYSGEALHGLVGEGATGFPLPLAMGCSWNPELVRRVFSAVSDEARAYHRKYNQGLNYYSPPTLNIHRDPRWGRCGEVYGEDPCHLSTFAADVIRGFQGDDSNYLKAVACAKHFICNNTDDDRYGVSASVNPRNFWEYYTRAFRAAVMDGDVFAVMAAYNAVNGVPCPADRFLLTSLLRDRWSFRGYVASDCDAVACIYNPHHYVPTLHQAAALAMQAGCDFNCGDTMPQHLGKAVADELVSEADISRAVERALTTRFLLGEFDPPSQVPYSKIGFDVVNCPAHQKLALEMARQSIVLLKNNGRFLPLDKSACRKVAIIGPLAHYHAGNYGNTSPGVRISVLDGLANEFGESVGVQRHWAVSAARMSVGPQSQPSSEAGTDVGWISNGAWLEFMPQNLEGVKEFKFRVASPALGGHIEVHLGSLKNPPVARAEVPVTGGFQKWITVQAPVGKPLSGTHRIVLKFIGAPGPALFNLEWYEVTPNPKPQPGKAYLVYEPGCGILGPKDDQLFNRAVNAAREADLVIMVCGINQSVDREYHDRKTTDLTGVQHELIKACFNANPKTVLVLNTNNTVAINWEQANLPAIVGTIFAGQAQGTAIADVLFGNYNPGGKTCCTWYKSVDQLPSFHDYDIIPNGQNQPLKSGQVSGRTYMYFEGEPLYPFGYGLSYTTFKFNGFKISSDSLAAGGEIKVSAAITNTGKRSGAEVAQFYITAPKSRVKRPIKQLVGFQRVELKPGESRRVTFTLPYNEQALWYWHEDLRKFVLQPGTLKLMIGSSSADIHLTGRVSLQACTDGPLGGPETLNTVAVKSVVSG